MGKAPRRQTTDLTDLGGSNLRSTTLPSNTHGSAVHPLWVEEHRLPPWGQDVHFHDSGNGGV